MIIKAELTETGENVVLKLLTKNEARRKKVYNLLNKKPVKVLV
jgi:hypothetical protein